MVEAAHLFYQLHLKIMKRNEKKIEIDESIIEYNV